MYIVKPGGLKRKRVWEEKQQGKTDISLNYYYFFFWQEAQG